MPTASTGPSVVQQRGSRAPLLNRVQLFAASVAGAVLLGAAALAVVPPASRASGAAMLAVVEPGGSCTLRAVEPARLARVEGALAEEAERLQGMAERLMADAAAARLAEAREQVPAFGAWAYDWVQSYITSYRVLGRLIRAMASSAPDGDAGTALSDRLMAEVSQPMRDEFRRRVLPPDLADSILRDLAHVAALVEAAWQEAVQAAAADLAAAPQAAATVAAPRFDLYAAMQPMAPALAGLPARDALFGVAEDPADTAMIFMRSMRPMAARLGAAAVRASEAGSVIAGAGAFGYAIAGVPGVAIGAVGGIGVSWAIDWGLNRIDAALNRAEFESQALLALQAAERRIAERAAAVAGAALDERLGALRGPAVGCGVVGAQR